MKKLGYEKVSHPQLHSCEKPELGPQTLYSEPMGNQAQKRLFSHVVYTYGFHYTIASGTFSPNSFTMHCTVTKVNLIVSILRMGFLPYPSIPWISSVLSLFSSFRKIIHVTQFTQKVGILWMVGIRELAVNCSMGHLQATNILKMHRIMTLPFSHPRVSCED